MIPVVHSIEEAQVHFLFNNGDCVCKKGDKEKVVSNYTEAARFFKFG